MVKGGVKTPPAKWLRFRLMRHKNLSSIRRKLLRWYDQNRRDLPWRRTGDPYAIWIAETMLQQTQVATVVPYYERFLDTFPTVDALARAPLKKVLALWSGLGYYRRARNLKLAARILVRRYAGHLPANYDDLLALPGVGDYTAGALMSIAFQKPYPAIDGNARRVLGRLFNLTGEKKLRSAAADLVSRSRPGHFNQGLMELGATICTPKNPRCPKCPLRRDCAAQNGDGRMATTAKKYTGVKAVTWPLAVVRRRGKILLRRRAADGILAGLWELPGGEIRGHKSARACLKRHLRELDGTLKSDLHIGEFRHSITNRRVRSPLYLFDVRIDTELSRPGPNWRWISPSSLDGYPVSSMTRKALRILATYEKSFL
ncbi:MAG: A/G-specific adenine glycosylase [Deltaproteobacteria bacterium]|nr:A/G-specific adenine glycosylase [Deltaproteobacteria bacterium]MDZ4341295.1 A/G-specific adenine glycosylase [Candidatus Binatia bacterium]